MSQEMPSSWRYLTSARSHVSTLKGLIAGRESASGSRSPRTPTSGHDAPNAPQSWRAWAGKKIRVNKSGMYGSESVNTELVNVFPGWAARKYPASATRTGLPPEDPKPFELEVFVSGYAISYRPPESASRSQRAFMRLAKGYAYLPKLVEDAGDVLPNTSSLAQLTPSTEELLASVKLPPRPTEITDDYEMEQLELQLQRAKKIIGNDGSSANSSPSSSTEDLHGFGNSGRASAPSPYYSINTNGSSANDVIRRLHANLEKRLQPFWSSVIPNRTIRVHVFASPHHENQGSRTATLNNSQEELSLDSEHGPIASQDVVTSADGSFQLKFTINWEELCQHPTALHIAFGESITEHDLLVVAQLLPVNNNSYPSYQPNTPSLPSSVPLSSLTRIPITHSPIRVISDVDDTIKLSGILLGARVVFHNVFVKELTDNIIPGMGEWYASMWKRGVRFHYVSNGPFEYLPVLNEFFEISKLPPGSIKLRSYAGRSLFSGLLTAPAARKRAGVVDVLDSFPDSRFFLIGDTGEQDLELYADLARERPDRILAVFVRDADASTDPLEDPTGWNALGAAGTRANDRPLVPRSESMSSSTSTSSFSTDSFSKYSYTNIGSPLNPANVDAHRTPRPNSHGSKEKVLPNTYFSNNTLINEPEPFEDAATPILTAALTLDSANAVQQRNRVPSLPPSVSSRLSAKFTNQPPRPVDPPSIHNSFGVRSSAVSSRSQQSTSSASSAESYGKQPLSEADRRRRDLQMRVYRARTQMPGHIPLRVFRDPKECAEAQQILDREQ